MFFFAKLSNDIHCPVGLLKLLKDGSFAPGIFNLGNSKRSMTVDVSTLGAFGPQFTTGVERHGVTLLRLSRK